MPRHGARLDIARGEVALRQPLPNPYPPNNAPMAPLSNLTLRLAVRDIGAERVGETEARIGTCFISGGIARFLRGGGETGANRASQKGRQFEGWDAWLPQKEKSLRVRI